MRQAIHRAGEKEKAEAAAEREEDERIKREAAENKKLVHQAMKEEQLKATLAKAASKAVKEKRIHLDRDPLREWLIYACLAAVMVAVIGNKHLIYAVTTDSTYLCVANYVLFLVGLVFNFLGVRSLRVEYVCAAACVDRLKTQNGFKETLTAYRLVFCIGTSMT